MQTTICVQKYGGTSVGSIQKIKKIATRIKEYQQKFDHLVIVVSAMGQTTDELISLSQQIIVNPPLREYDALISNGENISAALMAITLHSLHIPAISLTGAQAGIATAGNYSKSKIININPQRILAELNKNQIVVITGFQGLNPQGDITTIGRGGSDTSAVAIAAALKADVCEIYTDVDGVYTTDPRLIKNAQKLSEIQYDEMLELASLGAKVLHPRAVECAKENNIVLHVRSSFNKGKGTLVKEVKGMEVNKPVTGITLNEDEISISVVNLPDKPGVAGNLFSLLAGEGVNVDMIIQSTQKGKTNTITFTVTLEDYQRAKKVTEKYAQQIGAENVKYEKDICKISIVGVGMISKPGVAATMFKALGDSKINIHLISTSEIKVSCVIDKQQGKKALQVLHKTFELEATC